MRYGVSYSQDYLGEGEMALSNGVVVIRDFKSEPKGRILAIIPRDNRWEAEQEAQYICDLLNQSLPK